MQPDSEEEAQPEAVAVGHCFSRFGAKPYTFPENSKKHTL